MKASVSKLMVALLIGAGPTIGGVAVGSSAQAATCQNNIGPSLIPDIPKKTAFGIQSPTYCPGGTSYNVTVTCNQIYSVFGWIDNNAGSGCNSNGPLLDYSNCSPGTWTYRTRSVVNGVNRYSIGTSITC